jgi:hypothetical protein
MTVCIAALCEQGSKVVVAADRMFTSPAVNVEFETDETKIEVLSHACVALSAGNSASATEILGGAKRRFGNNQSPWIVDAAESVRAEYMATRNRKADEQVVAPALGYDFDYFRAKGGTLPEYLEKQPQTFQNLTMLASQWNLILDIIVTGIDATGGHILQIMHPGTISAVEKLGYATIGTGAVHALTRLTLGAQTKHKSLAETVFAVFDAKKSAEAAPGVGLATDMAVIDAQKGVVPYTDTMVRSLAGLHANHTKQSPPDLASLRAMCNDAGQ